MGARPLCQHCCQRRTFRDVRPPSQLAAKSALKHSQQRSGGRFRGIQRQGWGGKVTAISTVVPGFSVLGFSVLPGFRALNAGDGAWSVHKTLFGFRAPLFQHLFSDNFSFYQLCWSGCMFFSLGNTEMINK